MDVTDALKLESQSSWAHRINSIVSICLIIYLRKEWICQSCHAYPPSPRPTLQFPVLMFVLISCHIQSLVCCHFHFHLLCFSSWLVVYPTVALSCHEVISCIFKSKPYYSSSSSLICVQYVVLPGVDICLFVIFMINQLPPKTCLLVPWQLFMYKWYFQAKLCLFGRESIAHC